MKKTLQKCLLVSAMTVFSALSVSAMAAAPWSHKTHKQIHQYHRLGHKANQQSRAAARAWSHGNIGGAISHTIRAEDLHARQMQKGHQIHHSIHKWNRNHRCANGLYC